MTTEYNKEDFNAAVQAEVEKILSSREEDQARLAAEEALQEAKETFEALKASLEAKDAKIREYEEALANLDSADPSEAEFAANEKIVELEKDVEEWKHKAEVALAALDVIAREETAACRMAELEEAGVVLDDEACEAQYAKVRNLDDEAFAAYKSELVALKSKYFTASEEEVDDTPKHLELSDDKIQEISSRLGCDPADSECIALVKEVAEMVTAVTAPAVDAGDDTTEGTEEAASDNEPQKKETASEKMSFGEAITRSVNQEFRADPTIKDECTQEWEALYAERKKKRARKSE
jgi:hypothetical protein